MFFPELAKVLQIPRADGTGGSLYRKAQAAFRKDLKDLLQIMDDEAQILNWKAAYYENDTMSRQFAVVVLNALQSACDSLEKIVDSSRLYDSKQRILGSRILSRMEKLGIDDTNARERFRRIYKRKYVDPSWVFCRTWFRDWIEGRSWELPNAGEIECLAEALECKPEDLCPWLKDEAAKAADES